MIKNKINILKMNLFLKSILHRVTSIIKNASPFLIIISLVAYFFPTFAKAESVSYSQKLFIKEINSIEKILLNLEAHIDSNGDSIFQCDKIINSGLRIAGFNLQSVARMHKDYPVKSTRKVIEFIRAESQNLEDAIGDYDKYKTIDEKKKQQKAANKLIKILTESKWLGASKSESILTEMRDKVFETEWQTSLQDQSFVLDSLKEQLDIAKDTDYDLDKLEKGLHEFRRELRWFAIYARSLNGLLQTSASCDYSQKNFTQYALEKYSVIPKGNEPTKCEISQCLFTELAGAVEYFGLLKDQAEPIVDKDESLKKNDKTPKEISENAISAYKKLKKSEVLEKLASEIKLCL